MTTKKDETKTTTIRRDIVEYRPSNRREVIT